MKRSILKYYLFLLFSLLLLSQNAPAQDLPTTDIYLIGSKNILADSSKEKYAFHGQVVYNLDNVFIAQATSEDSLNGPSAFTQTCPLKHPLDSLMSLYFESTRRLDQAAFVLTLNDTCQIQSVLPFEFKILTSPLREINIFTIDQLGRNEFYFDFNLRKVKVDSQMNAFLFFEFLWQQFLNKKVLANKIYTESMFSALAAAFRPAYASELHFYLDAGAANEVVRKWVKIKQAFMNYLSDRMLNKQYAAFKEKLKLITETSHSKMIVWAKLMSRYGYHQNLNRLFEDEVTFLPRFQKAVPNFVRNMQLIWFRSSEIDKDLVKELQKQNIENGVRIFVQ